MAQFEKKSLKFVVSVQLEQYLFKPFDCVLFPNACAWYVVLFRQSRLDECLSVERVGSISLLIILRSPYIGRGIVPDRREQAELCPPRQIILQVLGNDWHLKEREEGPQPHYAVGHQIKKCSLLLTQKNRTNSSRGKKKEEALTIAGQFFYINKSELIIKNNLLFLTTSTNLYLVKSKEIFA